jgi:hypothetical protein
VQIIVGIIAFVCGLAAAVLIAIANAIYTTMVEEVDVRSGPGEKLGRRFFSQGNAVEVLKRHRMIFPLSLKRRRAVMFTLGGMVLAILSSVMIEMLVSGSIL